MAMDNERRRDAYLRQTGRKAPTPRQRRRLQKKNSVMKHRSSGRR